MHYFWHYSLFAFSAPAKLTIASWWQIGCIQVIGDYLVYLHLHFWKTPHEWWTVPPLYVGLVLTHPAVTQYTDKVRIYAYIILYAILLRAFLIQSLRIFCICAWHVQHFTWRDKGIHMFFMHALLMDYFQSMEVVTSQVALLIKFRLQKVELPPARSGAYTYQCIYLQHQWRLWKDDGKKKRVSRWSFSMRNNGMTFCRRRWLISHQLCRRSELSPRWCHRLMRWKMLHRLRSTTLKVAQMTTSWSIPTATWMKNEPPRVVVQTSIVSVSIYYLCWCSFPSGSLLHLSCNLLVVAAALFKFTWHLCRLSSMHCVLYVAILSPILECMWINYNEYILPCLQGLSPPLIHGNDAYHTATILSSPSGASNRRVVI